MSLWTVKQTVDVTITPEIAANAFAVFDSSQQADFFNHLAEIVKEWGADGWTKQMAWLRDEKHLTLDAKLLMREEMRDTTSYLVAKTGEECLRHVLYKMLGRH